MRERAVRAVLFDLDGTLIDSLELIARSFRHMLLEHGRESAPAELWRQGIGRPLEVQLASLARDSAELHSMVASYRAYNARHHDELVRVFPGIPEALAQLLEQGKRLAVVTSKARPGAMRALSYTGLLDCFRAVVAAGDTSQPKPAPDPVWHALQALGERPEDAFVVGDALPDLLARRAAGTRTAAVLWGACDRATLAGAGPDRILSATNEISSL